MNLDGMSGPSHHRQAGFVDCAKQFGAAVPAPLDIEPDFTEEGGYVATRPCWL
jgi:hypothetical protein